jgi:hypothetical protein
MDYDTFVISIRECCKDISIGYDKIKILDFFDIMKTTEHVNICANIYYIIGKIKNIENELEFNIHKYRVPNDAVMYLNELKHYMEMEKIIIKNNNNSKINIIIECLNDLISICNIQIVKMNEINFKYLREKIFCSIRIYNDIKNTLTKNVIIYANDKNLENMFCPDFDYEYKISHIFCPEFDYSYNISFVFIIIKEIYYHMKCPYCDKKYFSDLNKVIILLMTNFENLISKIENSYLKSDTKFMKKLFETKYYYEWLFTYYDDIKLLL